MLAVSGALVRYSTVRRCRCWCESVAAAPQITFSRWTKRRRASRFGGSLNFALAPTASALVRTYPSPGLYERRLCRRVRSLRPVSPLRCRADAGWRR
jgi:hypothetical protein